MEEMSCSLFVALAEEGWQSGAAATAVAEQYLAPVRARPAEERPDTAILGCTHFPLVRPVIAAALGDAVHIVDSATTAAEAVRSELEAAALLTDSADGGKLRLIATDGARRFSRIGSAFLGQDFQPQDIEIVDIHPTDMGRGQPG